MITCPQCNRRQIGGSICSKCGYTFREQDLDAQESGIISQANMGRSSQIKVRKDAKKQTDSFAQHSKKNHKFELPPPPERVKRKQLERAKFRRSGFGKFIFWIYNLCARGLESVIFCSIFHGGIWLLIELGNFFGGMVAPENRVKFDIMTIYQWEYLAFVLITIFTYRRRWGL